jgi:ankyrin repeat protein
MKKNTCMKIKNYYRKVITILFLSNVSCLGMEQPNALSNAIAADNVPLVATLINSGVGIETEDVDYTPLIQAFIHGNREIISLLIKAGVNPNEQDKDGYAPLHFAVLYDADEFVSSLIAAGADVNKQNVHGYTPLHYAVLNSNKKIVEILLDAQANPHSMDWEVKSPLALAKADKDLEIIALLEKYAPQIVEQIIPLIVGLTIVTKQGK